MVIAILASQGQRDEMLNRNIQAEIVWVDSLRVFSAVEADAYLDLQFQMDPERIERLNRLLPAPLIVNAVAIPGRDLPSGFTRMNGWNTMLKRSVAELAPGKEANREKVKQVFELLDYKPCFLPDFPGMISPRIIAGIVNEAYFTLEAGVSSKEEIDIAMKLGTNYPEGPFKWSEQIGLENIYELLKQLARHDDRYNICDLLIEELNASKDKNGFK